ncbi:hypothetical protein FPOAC2_00132 [Fusarium poae]
MIRLLDARTRTIAPRGRGTPPYAILSHTWGNARDEITFQQALQADHSEFEHLLGYQKIVGACDFALRLGFEHVWADTCCIDKTDYNVLSTALGYMFQWYRDAEICCVYLHDVVAQADPTLPGSEFRNSRWFRRGWTLQELIAPRQVVFFNRNWDEIGTKSSLLETITQITNIPSQVLLMNHPGEMSIAQCMSWASGRETSRVEDRAYSLMGLLGVTIPMLYGEGEKAFERLQLEIIKNSDDHSIFAWTTNENRRAGCLLARSPDDFANSHDIRQVIDNNANPNAAPVVGPAHYGMTNKGLRITLPLEPLDPITNTRWATLNCRRGGNGPLLRIRLQGDGRSTIYQRIDFNDLQPVGNANATMTQIYVKGTAKRSFEIRDWIRTEPEYLFVVRHRENRNGCPRITCPTMNWVDIGQDEGFLLRIPHDDRGHSGILAFRHPETGRRLEISIGLHNYSPWCWMLDNPNPHFTQFWQDQQIHDERSKNRDRHNIDIANVGNVSVEINRGCYVEGPGQQRRMCWYVDINFPQNWSYVLEALQRGCCPDRPDVPR